MSRITPQESYNLAKHYRQDTSSRMTQALPDDLIQDLKEQFQEFDKDGNGYINAKELGDAFAACGNTVPGYKLREIISQVDKDKNGKVSFDEFIEIYKQTTSKGVFGEWKSSVTKKQGINVLESSEASASGTTHSASEAELIAFTDWINTQLKTDPDCAKYIPLNKQNMTEALKDGIILCKMINLSAPKTIDERAINKTKLSAFRVQENNILVINSASSIGCTVVNVHAEDLGKGKQHLLLGLLWQIIRIGLFANITLQSNPNIAVLLEEGETIEDLLKLSPEQLLLRWVNYHLRKSGSHKRINNFSGDIKDSEAYSILLNQIAPNSGMDSSERMIQSGDSMKRAEMVLKNADRINCKKFVSAKDISTGNQKLNLAFVANLFNNYPALDPADMEEVEEFEPYIETREEKTYRNWMNSLGVDPGVNHLYHDMSDGYILFQLYDQIRKDTVNWNKVNKPPYKIATAGTMKKIENCNYVVELGKQNNYSLVGIGGQDIHKGTHTLILALVWQMLRDYTMTVLGKLTESSGAIKDKEIVDWVNHKLTDAGKTSRISSFKDPSISSGIAVIDLVDAIYPGFIDYELVTPGETAEDKESNAQYAISMSRKIGARTYALPEDIVEVKPKMLLTVFASLMTRGLQE